MKTVLKALPLALLLSACSFVPQYEQPEVSLDQQWMQIALENNVGKTAQELGWREYFRDPQLQGLITAALEHNHNLKTAALNVESAAEQYSITKTNELPTIALTGGVSRSGTGEAASGIGRAVYSTAYKAAVGVNAFELDFFGRVRALTENALDTYLQTREARDAAQLSVIKNVAQAYYTARVYSRLMALSQNVLKSYQETARLARLQLNAGVITALAYKGYENLIESAKASYYGYQRNYEQSVNALSVLVGLPVRELPLAPAANLEAQFAQLSIPPGIPSAVLQNRPDVRQAEYTLMAANANIGAAKAALFPSISLTSNFGYASTELTDLIKKPSSLWSIAPSITLPIFNRDKLKSNVRISEITQQKAVENYQTTVQSAFQEVSNALIARQTYDEQYQAIQRAVAAQKEVIQLSKMRFQAGVDDGLSLLEAERTGYLQQQNLLTTQLALLQNMVTLYTAMGGGLNEYGVSAPNISQNGEQSLVGIAQTKPTTTKRTDVSSSSPQLKANTSSIPNRAPAGAKRIAL